MGTLSPDAGANPYTELKRERSHDERGGGERPMALEMEDGWRVQARTVVIASGARYRKLALPNLEQFQNRGIWYWVSPIEAKLCANAEVIIARRDSGVRTVGDLHRKTFAFVDPATTAGFLFPAAFLKENGVPDLSFNWIT
jgi:thioredoxin reductase